MGLVRQTMRSGSRRQVVGVDSDGNKYIQDGERRYVEFAKKDETLTTQVPPPWQMWMRGRREAPTPEEMAAREAADMRMKIKIAEIEERDARERLEAYAESSSPHAQDAAMAEQAMRFLDDPSAAPSSSSSSPPPPPPPSSSSSSSPDADDVYPDMG